MTASGTPTPTLSEAAGDTLPVGVTFNASTGVLSGTPGPGSGGVSTLHFTAHNGVGADATQTFRLTVTSLPFSDNFSTATDQQLSDYWINQVGNFQVNPASSKARGFAGYDLATLVGVDATNVAVEATVTLTTGQAAGLVADYTGTGDGSYYFGSVYASGINAYQANIYRASNGAYTPLFTQSYTGSANGDLQFDVYGSSLELFLNGNLVAYGNDTSLTGGSVGMRTNADAVLSNFTDSALTVATPTLPFSDTFTTVTSPEAGQLTSNWINQVGNFSVNTSTSTASGFGSLDLATLSGVSIANVTVQANVAVTVGQAAALVSRYTGSGDQNYYLGGVFNTGSGVQVFLYSNVNGNFNLLQSKMVNATSGTLILTTEGNSLSLSYNGSVLLTVADFSISGAGSVGMRTNAGATVQAFSASVPTSGLPFSDTFSGTQLSTNWVTQIGSFQCPAAPHNGDGWCERPATTWPPWLVLPLPMWRFRPASRWRPTRRPVWWPTTRAVATAPTTSAASTPALRIRIKPTSTVPATGASPR